MCLKCGDMDHFDNSVIEKALNSGSLEKPRFKTIEQYEAEFKKDYEKSLDDTMKEVFDELI